MRVGIFFEKLNIYGVMLGFSSKLEGFGRLGLLTLGF